MLTLNSVSKSFGTPGEINYRLVLDNLSFHMEKGESIAILGPSGSGKTSLLNIIGSLDFPDAGELLFRDKNLRTYSNSELENFRNKEIGFVFQQHHLLPQCTLLENVLLPSLLVKDKDEKLAILNRAEELLKRMGIWEHRDKIPGKMSGGECQRAALVRAIINKPSLLLADEPSGALDKKNAGNIADLLNELNESDGLSILLVTHSQDLAERMGKIYQLIDGKLEPDTAS
ncbi:MAG: ABC transporter ATP-binding protein [Bacteroidales bacterium]|nr:ABC transporter ATP-binding protein [Bacteroidales bacterium]MCB8999675.1 ABC transporter ATP-binding protein [Bacteroidales bacterium]MCB9012750.1 ABC transporter ATP-binding protein [Bacteroidales bacterium]